MKTAVATADHGDDAEFAAECERLAAHIRRLYRIRRLTRAHCDLIQKIVGYEMAARRNERP